MTGSDRPLWFWQRILSPHMAGLAEALARRGRSVSYVAEEAMAEDLTRRGWSAPNPVHANLIIAPTVAEFRHLAELAPPDAIHICQGIRSNGPVGAVQRVLARKGTAFWIFMERIDDAGWQGWLRRLVYRGLFMRWRGRIAGVLAAGGGMSAWASERGLPAERIFPFAYFLPERPLPPLTARCSPEAVTRVIFVGQLIERKRLDLLICALATLPLLHVELVVIGTGPEEFRLRALAEKRLPGRVRWRGGLPMRDVPEAMAQADCLVLPSRHDGWGAVGSESLMVGTPVICSDRCGVAEVVRASGVGGVFRAGDQVSLAGLLSEVIAHGPMPSPERIRLAEWAGCLGAEVGASYLLGISAHANGSGYRPEPPWQKPLESGSRFAGSLGVGV